MTLLIEGKYKQKFRILGFTISQKSGTFSREVSLTNGFGTYTRPLPLGAELNVEYSEGKVKTSIEYGPFAFPIASLPIGGKMVPFKFTLDGANSIEGAASVKA